jgi:type II secretory pathway component PulJ
MVLTADDLAQLVALLIFAVLALLWTHMFNSIE